MVVRADGVFSVAGPSWLRAHEASAPRCAPGDGMSPELAGEDARVNEGSGQREARTAQGEEPSARSCH
jgi:hypothetical protein